MSLSLHSSTLSFASDVSMHPRGARVGAKYATRPYSAQSPRTQIDISVSTAASKHQSLQYPPYSLPHKNSVSSFTTLSTANHIVNSYRHSSYTLGDTHPASQTHLRRQIVDKNMIKKQLKHQQKIQQKRTLPLFPTERTRGSSSVQNALKPVDITQIELLPIEFSHKIIMICIDEIKLRGLKHKHLFRNPFYSPAVEAALKLLLDSKTSHLFNVKMMRLDTVGGLLTTVLSRTYPPLIPLHIHELFQNPNGRFFFELLSLLPELNRFLFVEILGLCCDLVDNQIYNHLSNSKLSVYPGSCCFGLGEYMPTWDTRYLLTTGLKTFSSVFYHVIYAYREERDLSAEELEQKQITRDRIMAEERLEALEREHGLEGAQIILRREARIAKGLPPDSPEPPPAPQLPSDIKEVSLYAGRKERVVADDAISVLDIRLDDGSNGDSAPKVIVPNMGSVKDEEEENVEHIIADLRKGISVANLGYSSTPVTSTVLVNTTTRNTNMPSWSSPLNGYSVYSATRKYYTPAGRYTMPPTHRPGMARLKSIARSGTVTENIYPVLPGDIFGISQHAIERTELQGFLSAARTHKRRKSGTSKRIVRLRLQNRLLRQLSTGSSSDSASTLSQSSGSRMSEIMAPPVCAKYRIRNTHLSQRPSHGVHHQSIAQEFKRTLATLQGVRRERTRQLRRELQVYLTRGLSEEEAAEQRKVDKRRQRRREKREREVAQVRAAAEALAEAERATAAAKISAVVAPGLEDVTMEEAEVLEAFEYLTDKEFEEFMTLAGLTIQDVERIREKAASAALSQLTKDIAAVDDLQSVKQKVESKQPPTTIEPVIVTPKTPSPAASAPKTLEAITTQSIMATTTTFGSSYSSAETEGMATADTQRRRSRPISIPHMNSMDILIKNVSMIGDSNLRCYPMPPPSTAATTSMQRPTSSILLSQTMDRGAARDMSATSTVSDTLSVKGRTASEETLVSKEGDIRPAFSRDRRSEESTASSTETIVGAVDSIKDQEQSSLEFTNMVSFVQAGTIKSAQVLPPSEQKPAHKENGTAQARSKISDLAPGSIKARHAALLKQDSFTGQQQNKALPAFKANYFQMPKLRSTTTAANPVSAPTHAPAPTPGSTPTTRSANFSAVQAMRLKLEKDQPNTPHSSKATNAQAFNRSRLPVPTSTIGSRTSTSALAAALAPDSTPASTPAASSTIAPPRLTPNTTSKPHQQTTMQPVYIEGPQATKAIPSASTLYNKPQPSIPEAAATTSVADEQPTSAPAPAPVPMTVSAPITPKTVEFAMEYQVQNDGDDSEEEVLQLLKVVSEDENQDLSHGCEKTLDDDVIYDEEAAELQELLESMSGEERQEFLRLSRQDFILLPGIVITADF
ncbi:hypothetical protein EDD11_001352 [Mortierella claussenii]|nr:hypothetical protein EDD11_001352 [Mortierella claussenii]